MKTNALIRTDYSILPAPQMVSPQAGVRVGKNKILFLHWQGVRGAQKYRLQVQYYDAKSAVAGATWRNIPEANITTTRNSFTLPIDDIFQGRWRVMAIGKEGVESEFSEWRRFVYKIGQFDFYTPKPLLPVNKAFFDYYKRNMVFTWASVARASNYGWQAEFYKNGKWHVMATRKVNTTTFRYQVGEGLYKLRWRVWAVWRGKYSRTATTSKSSRWMYFEHKK